MEIKDKKPLYNVVVPEEKIQQTTNSKSDNFFLVNGVKICKDELLKNRLQTLIHSKGLSEADFYNKLGISRQYWYYISWGIWECSVELKVRIAQELDIDSSVVWDLGDKK